jgi:stage III sporulation protein SpoIIIAA
VPKSKRSCAKASGSRSGSVSGLVSGSFGGSAVPVFDSQERVVTVMLPFSSSPSSSQSTDTASLAEQVVVVPQAYEGYQEELARLLAILPPAVRDALTLHDCDALTEIVLDLGRPAEARFIGGRFELLGDSLVTAEALAFTVKQLGEFALDNRAGLTKTLHRISAIRNRHGDVVGLTCRVGRVVLGTIGSIEDIIRSGKSILLLGRPGSGKTTKLREVARLMANEANKRVIIVDTSNEIAGDGDIPHPTVGRARRMQVKNPLDQQAIMIEAVENHTPEVIVIDEIGTEAEAQAARTIAERGVVLVATAHGSKLENLIKNPMLSDLIGGIQSVTLGDEEARRRMTQKTILEREKEPTFEVCIEIQDHNTLAVYHDVAQAVDALLRGLSIAPELRKIDSATGETRILNTQVAGLPEAPMGKTLQVTSSSFEVGNKGLLGSGAVGSVVAKGRPVFKVFLYAITRSFVDRLLERYGLQHLIVMTANMHEANAVLALRGHARPGAKVIKLAQDYEVPVFYAKTNTGPQIQRALREALEGSEVGQRFVLQLTATLGEQSPLLPWLQPLVDEGATLEAEGALAEVMKGIEQVLATGVAVELLPQRSYIRRLQHEWIEKQGLRSTSVGAEPERKLKILPLES